MKMEKGRGQMKDSGFSRPYGPFSANDAKKISDAIAKESTKKPAAKKAVAKKLAAKPMAKPTVKVPTKTTTKAPAKKPAPLKGPAAIKEYQRQVSPKGVKKAEEGAKKGIDKKYPGLYKKSK